MKALWSAIVLAVVTVPLSGCVFLAAGAAAGAGVGYYINQNDNPPAANDGKPPSMEVYNANATTSS